MFGFFLRNGLQLRQKLALELFILQRLFQPTLEKRIRVSAGLCAAIPVNDVAIWVHRLLHGLHDCNGLRIAGLRGLIQRTKRFPSPSPDHARMASLRDTVSMKLGELLLQRSDNFARYLIANHPVIVD